MSEGNGTATDRREIFTFHDETRTRRVDPLVIDHKWRKELMIVDSESIMSRWNGPPWLKELAENGKITSVEVPEATVNMALDARDDAMMELLPMLYRTFGCTPYTFDEATGEESGTTAAGMLRIWTEFLSWQWDVKKNTGDGPPSDTPTPAASPS